MAQLYNTVLGLGAGSWELGWLNSSVDIMQLADTNTALELEPGDPMVPPLIAD